MGIVYMLFAQSCAFARTETQNALYRHTHTHTEKRRSVVGGMKIVHASQKKWKIKIEYVRQQILYGGGWLACTLYSVYNFMRVNMYVDKFDILKILYFMKSINDTWMRKKNIFWHFTCSSFLSGEKRNEKNKKMDDQEQYNSLLVGMFFLSLSWCCVTSYKLWCWVWMSTNGKAIKEIYTERKRGNNYNYNNKLKQVGQVMGCLLVSLLFGVLVLLSGFVFS